jgi:hypothetical protein
MLACDCSRNEAQQRYPRNEFLLVVDDGRPKVEARRSCSAPDAQPTSA